MTRERVAELPSLRPVIAEILNGLSAVNYLAHGKADRGARLAYGARTLLWCEDALDRTDLAEQRTNLKVELEDLRDHLDEIREILDEGPHAKGAAKLVAKLLATF